MASRREVAQRQMEMERSLRAAIQNGSLLPGLPAPSVRELSQQYTLSINVVRRALQKLTDEGLLYTVPRVGTFIGKRKTTSFEYYLLLFKRLPVSGDHYSILQQGFEERIAQLGGFSLVMLRNQAKEVRASGQLPHLAGVFDFSELLMERQEWGEQGARPLVCMEGAVEDPAYTDIVSFDNVDGGRQVTHHLLSLGHGRIAYLGLHQAGDDLTLPWSSEREEGWRQAMESASISTDALAFHPATSLTYAAMEVDRNIAISYADHILRELACRPDITAVVAANDLLAMHFLEAMRRADIPASRWPAIAGFDNYRFSNGFMFSSLRLPWEEIGRHAADLLWERQHGRLTGEPTHRTIPMRLTARMTSQYAWGLLSEDSFTMDTCPVERDPYFV